MLNSVILQGVYKPTLTGLSSTGHYFTQLVGSVEPTADFLYDNVLTNPIFYGIILVILILSLITFSD